MLPIPCTICIGYIEMQCKNSCTRLGKKTEKYGNKKKPLCMWVREIFTSVSSNEGLVWLCLTPCDWCTKLATAPQPNQCKTETDCY